MSCRWRKHVRNVIRFCRRGEHLWAEPAVGADYEVCVRCFARRKRSDAS